MSESRELELHTIDGAGDDIITTAVDNDSNEETRNESAEDKPFQRFFRRVPANQVRTPAISRSLSHPRPPPSLAHIKMHARILLSTR